ncbi:outer membrane-stress sensor serine endopeptidase DegS [Aeromonas simiae]|uniref:Outer membrane-stress sensor serine endopeptidase DegS n=1 Tax=Aeromonas simiae TaxID=218936 RepID=A0A5J6WXA7_9GAMM|nr:outer membrane-stress sensor serine endopeptidase DegS [Aeromonas simiae]MDO2948215.1 outer membrane-stress sensor serine endopeptidase DegS [Aeromonas simiae]MDO2951696.1 outer membrane-stress sensor serine endopeptidase DegS [Aeromonas simiae]MDO2955596.1 outer membrane-stress sensor serine endopeptidase DegS [Aeromonas simiae]QFI55766.1 outer membrane-stress sensor serine endopeptidase DegS [Aeromonas simiae]
MKIPPTLSYLSKAIGFGLAMAAILLLFFPALRGGAPMSISSTRDMSFSYAAHRAGPAVVNIYTRSFTSRNNQSELTPQGLGSGVIMSERGHILTNYHVIAEADQIIVALQDGRIFTAELVGTDKLTDLAVLYIEADSLPVIPQNPENQPEVGDIVLAIGNPYNVGQTITQGIISATGRIGLSSMGPESNGRQDLLQTDAAINEGNSGGALVNARGDLVGINTAAYHINGNQESYGISFAIPYKLAKRIMDELITHGRVIRGYLGISSIEINPIIARMMNLGDLSGLVVENLDPNGPATKAGMLRGDVLLKINGEAIKGIRNAMDRIVETRPGSKLTFTIVRDGKSLDLPVVIEEDLRYPQK